jgi:hypothetical protein
MPLTDDADALDRALALALAKAGDFVAAVGMVRLRAHAPLNQVTVPVMVHSLVRDLDQHQWTYNRLILTGHANDLRTDVPTFLSPREERRLFQHIANQLLETPTMPYFRLRASANRAHFVEGDFRSAILLDFAAIEVLFDSLLLMLHWEHNDSVEQAAASFMSRRGGDIAYFSLGRRLRTSYHPLLGCPGWTTKGDSQLAKWFGKCAPLRNKCIHAGYWPSHAEADESFRLSNDVTGFISDQLRPRRTAFPITVAVFLGSPTMKEQEIRSHQGWLTQVRALLADT